MAAAACLSPSPSGRRLADLLEEKQEPFLLDLHLLEKGCSSSRLLLDGYDTALCWPAPGNDAVLKRLTSKKQSNKQSKKQQAPGLLKLLLSKIVLRGNGKQQGRKKKPAALQFSDSFKVVTGGNNKPAAVAPAPCAADLNAAVMSGQKVVKEREAERYHYDSDSDDDEKQFSPVSVLEHPFDSSPVHHAKLLSPVHAKLSPSGKNAHAMDVFRELLDAAYSPALLTHLLANATSEDDLTTDTTSSSSSCSAADEDEDCYDDHRASSPKKEAAYWEAHRAELARVSELVASEVPTARLDHAALLPEREDVGAAVATAVLDALLRELVADLATC